MIINAKANDTGRNIDRSSVFMTVGETVGNTARDGGLEGECVRVLKEGLYVEIQDGLIVGVSTGGIVGDSTGGVVGDSTGLIVGDSTGLIVGVSIVGGFVVQICV